MGLIPKFMLRVFLSKILWLNESNVRRSRQEVFSKTIVLLISKTPLKIDFSKNTFKNICKGVYFTVKLQALGSNFTDK